MLNPENARKVVAALRSGDYQQCEGFLEREGLNCCLGVTCREAIKDGVPIKVEEYEDRYPDSDPVDKWVTFDGAGGCLPNKAVQWLYLDDLGSGNPRLVVPDSIELIDHTSDEDEPIERDSRGRVQATTLNDRCKLTFAQIANCIEATVEQEASA